MEIHIQIRCEGKVEALLDAGMDFMEIKAFLINDILNAQEEWDPDYGIPIPFSAAQMAQNVSSFGSKKEAA